MRRVALLSAFVTACTAAAEVTEPRRDPVDGRCVDSHTFIAPQIYDPTWPTCWSPTCDALDQADCLATSGCRGIAMAPCPTGSSSMPPAPAFVTCWPIASSEPKVHAGCYDIVDPIECARHDECIAVHDHTVCDGSSYPSSFQYCWPEDMPLPVPGPPIP